MDQYEKRHIEKLNELNECELRVNNSCLKCKKFFDCNLRASYVDAVYKSMSKDNNGNFNF